MIQTLGTLFGGTWERIVDGFLFCGATESGKGHQGNLTGGAKSVAASGNTGSTTLTLNQIPAHSHDVRQRSSSPTPVSSFYNNNYTSGQAEYCLSSGGKMVNTGSTDNLFTTSQGGGKGHTHTLNSHTHNIPYTSVAVWKRTA